MPPKGEPRPSDPEIATLRAWIDSGRQGPQGEPADRMALVVPKIASHAKVRPITAARSLARRQVAGHRPLRLGRDPQGGGDGTSDADKPRLVLEDFPGKVTAVHFSADGTRLVTASGVVGLGGVAAIWNVEDGSMVRRFPGHRDLLFDAELSPDGKTLATCGYDRTIRLWDAEPAASSCTS